MREITYPLYPIIAFFGSILVLIPLPWHLQAWNSGTCYFIFWTFVACLNQFFNSVVWASDAVDRAPWFCEISTRITLGASVGIPAACLCISRRLFSIARVQAVLITPAERRRAIVIDSFLCILFPVIYVAVSYVVQGHRYDIFEQTGCYPAITNSVPAYLLVYMWPMILSLASAVFNVLSIRAFLIRQAHFRRFLSDNGALTSSRYFRLMALAITNIIFTLPLSIYEVVSNTDPNAIVPWHSWAEVHSNFDLVNQYPATLWNADPAHAIPLQLTRWTTPLCALVFFAYFGFAEEARKHYSNAFKVVRERFYRLWTRRSSSRSNFSVNFSEKISSGDILPAYTPSSSFTCGDVKTNEEGCKEKSQLRIDTTVSIPRFTLFVAPVSPTTDEFPTTPSTLHYSFTPSTGHLSFTPSTAQFSDAPTPSLTDGESFDQEHSQPHDFYHAV